jgi:hypothetical protein
MVTVAHALEVAGKSEATILSRGGKVLSTLPYLDRSGIRAQDELIGRALVLNALIDLNFKVSPKVIRQWIDSHKLGQFLTTHEASLLDAHEIAEYDRNALAWSLDALWALMWAGSLFDSLDSTSPIPDQMYSMCPHVRDGEGPEKFADKMTIRPFDEFYRCLDLYYRLHWYAFQYQLRDEYGTFDLPRFIERRRALEWLLSPDSTWDTVSMNT